MITLPLVYISFLSVFAAVALLLSKKEFKALQYIPPIVLLYLFIMILSSNGFFEKNEEIKHLYTTIKANMLPAMLFLFLLPHKITRLFKLGPKMLISFAGASLSLFLAFILIFFLFGSGSFDIEVLAPLAGSWMGGTANMLAVSSALQSSENAIGITMLIDSVDYALWVMLLLMLVPFSTIFNRFTQAKDSVKDITIDTACALHFSLRAYLWLIVSALFISLFSQILAIYFAKFIGSVSMWSIILATLAGMIFSFTPLANIKGIQTTASGMLYLLIALIASRANLSFDIHLLNYLLMGMGILMFHALFMVVFAKLFKLDLFSICVASLANIGGIASAPILSAAYSQSLVGVGVLMATLGYVIGTFAALFLAEVLRWLV